MKELSIEQKAKAYDKAIEKIKYVMEHGVSPVLNKEDLQNIFPQLKESEDERIRKRILFSLQKDIMATKNSGCNTKDLEKCIAWLEKQGEKESDPRYENLEEILAADNIYQMSMNDEMVQEAKEKAVNALSGICIGRLLGLEKQCKETSWKPSKEEMDVLHGLSYITNEFDEHKEDVITRLYQDLKREFFNGSSYENMFSNTEDDVRRRSTIQVLEYARSLDTYNQFGKADIDKNITWLEKQKPAEEYNITGIGSKKAQGKLGEMIKNLNPVNEILEQNPAWSEEDENRLESIIEECSFHKGRYKHGIEESAYYTLCEKNISWLKSLKDRVGCEVNCTTTKEWSEEDEINYNYALAACKCYGEAKGYADTETHQKTNNWLKSLKGRYTWKPSDEQMERLKGIINSLPHQEVLYSLYQDLLKLKG